MSLAVKKDVIIIGAGASGLFCAMECGKRGRRVLVLDHADRSCSKVLISGGGRCNFTNLNASAEHYLSANPHFCRSALARFSPQDLLLLLKQHNISWYEKEAGQLFCTRSSREIAAMLDRECSRAGVEIQLRCRIESVSKDRNFLVSTDQGVFTSESLVIATGGLSYESLGATGFGHTLARQFGLNVTELNPGLVPLLFSSQDQKTFHVLSGISLDAAVSCSGRTFRGPLLFTHRGLSGPAVLQASSYWEKESIVRVDIAPDLDLEAVFASERRSRIELKNLLGRFLPKRFSELWCEQYARSKPLVGYSDKDLRAVAAGLHAWEIRPRGTEGYSSAEVTRGGVDTRGISSKSMEAIGTPGLYFIGEVLDVTGHLGGYNLHWAWASAHAAGLCA